MDSSLASPSQLRRFAKAKEPPWRWIRVPWRSAMCSAVHTSRDRQLQPPSSSRESGLQKLIGVSFKVPPDSQNQTYKHICSEKCVSCSLISFARPRCPSPRLGFADLVK